MCETKLMSNRLYGVTIDKTARFWRLFYRILLFLNGIALGGLITALLIRNWVLRHCCTDGRWNPAYWDLADDLLPYHVVFGIASFFLAFALLIAWFIGRRRSGPQ